MEQYGNMSRNESGHGTMTAAKTKMGKITKAKIKKMRINPAVSNGRFVFVPFALAYRAFCNYAFCDRAFYSEGVSR
jgi:hypothetical protein